MNNKKQQNIQSEKTLTEIFKYNAGGEASEYHIIIHSTKPEDTYEEQLNAVLNTYDYLLTQELKGAVAILKRYFLSDAANQADTLLALTTEGSDCALSIVEQPPLDGTKIALWVYLLTDVQTQVLHNGLFEVKHSAYRHFWGGSAFNRAANSEYQTRLLLNDYVMQLMEQGCKLADNCIRTWFFVQNVDVNYAGVVKARNEVFVTQNLIPYLTQTAIGIREKLSVFGDDYDTPDGSCIRDFINVVDLAKAHVIAIRRILEKTQKEKVEVFNIGTGRGVSVLELINGFEKATGVKLNYQIVGRRAGDIEKVWANPDFANKELGWKAVETLEDTLRSAWNWQLKLRERGIQ